METCWKLDVCWMCPGIRRSAKHTIPSDQSINRLRNKQTDDEFFLVLSKPLTIEHLQCNIFFWNLACDQRNPKYYEREHVVGQLARTGSHPHILKTALLVYQFRVFLFAHQPFVTQLDMLVCFKQLKIKDDLSGRNKKILWNRHQENAASAPSAKIQNFSAPNA